MKTIDACGISCPEPLLMLKKAMQTDDDILLLVDSKNARDNCASYAEANGFKAIVNNNSDIYEIRLMVKNGI